jgi:hypothetical protein
MSYNENEVKTATTDFAKTLQSKAVGGGGIKAMSVKTGSSYRVNPFDIDVEVGFNARDFSTPEAMESIAEIGFSIAHEGVHENLLVRTGLDGRLKLVNGERRLRGTFYAINVMGMYAGVNLDEGTVGNVSIPVRLEVKGTSDIDRIANQRLLNTSVPFSIFEDGIIVKRLLAFNLSPKEIHEKTSMNPAYQLRALEALECPEQIKEKIRSGIVSHTFASQVLKESTSEQDAIEKIEQAVNVATAQGKTRATAKHVEGGLKTPRSEVRTIFEMIWKEGRNCNNGEMISVKFTIDEMKSIRNLLKAEIGL